MIRIDDCSLRPLQEHDLRTVLEWRNSPRIRMSMYTDQIISWRDHQAWFERIKRDPDIVYQIFEYKSRPAGVVNFICQSRDSRRYLWGFYLGDQSLPRGTGGAMGYLALQYIFESRGAHKVCGEVLDTNETSLRFHKKLGFIEEGHLHQHVLKGSSFLDVILFSILSDTWNESKIEIRKNIFQ